MDFAFRPLRRTDFPQLSIWLARPHVQQWWEHDPSPGAVEGDFGGGIDGTEATERFVVLLDGREIGLVQRYQIGDHPTWLHALKVIDCPANAVGIDYFIGQADLVGLGVGTAMLAQFVAATWERYPDATLMLADVRPENPASWRALEKNGFVRVWEGELDSGDPSDAGIAWVLTLPRPQSCR